MTEVLFNQLEKIRTGANKLANAVKSTLGPNGQGVLIKRTNSLPFITKDGVTVAKNINLEDTLENIGAELIKEVARKTVEDAGDGTTTATILADSMLRNGIRYISAGVSPVKLKAGMDYAVKIATNSIKDQAIPIKSEQDLINVANISTNGDQEISSMIAEAITKVGKDGFVRVERSQTGKTEVVVVSGMNLERGFISPYFVNKPEKMLCEFKNPLILVTDKRITTFTELLPSLQISAKKGKSLLIIAEDIEGEALATLIMNKQEAIISVCAIRAPYLSGQKRILMDDIAILTGGKVVSEDLGMSLTKVTESDFGTCENATIGKDTTVIIGGGGNRADIEARINQIRNEIESSKDSHEITRLKTRLAKINGGIGIIYIGGQTETEMNEKKDRAEDAIYATVAAEQEGIVPGGGITLLNASIKLVEPGNTEDDYNLGIKLIKDTLVEPFKVLCENSNVNHEIILNKLIDANNTDKYIGWDAKNGIYVNMIENGIVDPAKVVRLALENAASVIGLLLTTKATIYEKEHQRISEPFMEK